MRLHDFFTKTLVTVVFLFTSFTFYSICLLTEIFLSFTLKTEIMATAVPKKVRERLTCAVSMEQFKKPKVLVRL